MINKNCKLVTLIVTVSTLLVSISMAQAEKISVDDIFDNDSEFMRGFETGLFLRTKGGKVEEYGCEVKDNERAKG